MTSRTLAKGYVKAMCELFLLPAIIKYGSTDLLIPPHALLPDFFLERGIVAWTKTTDCGEERRMCCGALRWINSTTKKILIKQWCLFLSRRKTELIQLIFMRWLWVFFLFVVVCLFCLFIIAGVPYSLATIKFRLRGDALLWSSVIQEMKMAQPLTCRKKLLPQTCQFF